MLKLFIYFFLPSTTVETVATYSVMTVQPKKLPWYRQKSQLEFVIIVSLKLAIADDQL